MWSLGKIGIDSVIAFASIHFHVDKSFLLSIYVALHLIKI